ncbi:hypothetical protein BWI93_02995 [Siphonobacter sp. BAB-5385]|uniref:hypothetical protein n=1 Tax=Siphonobacter sp. BAB-5385 TaxID=1864822 RepID=UPI000B9EC6E6|nr:hypothetical protein [Siphonobacter sp. BAB-5385]OZI09608.1 hypothetical protein BWI93_02995 [Siphonobacter sp. BAB-5385]
MAKIPYICLTNWIHLIGFYGTTYLFTLFILSLKDFDAARPDIWDLALWSIVSSLILMFGYGFKFLAGLYLSVLILDAILFKFSQLSVLKAVLLEWLLLSLPFFYWALKYDYWLWFILSLSFLVTQIIKKIKIEKLLNNVVSPYNILQTTTQEL